MLAVVPTAARLVLHVSYGHRAPSLVIAVDVRLGPALLFSSGPTRLAPSNSSDGAAYATSKIPSFSSTSISLLSVSITGSSSTISLKNTLALVASLQSHSVTLPLESMSVIALVF